MTKPGRNDPCPCGSGKKYKMCCLTKDQSKVRVPLGSVVTHDELAVDDTSTSLSLTEAFAALRLAEDDDFDDDYLMIEASNAVVDLIHAGKLDEAEMGARELLAKYPDEPVGWDRLGMVFEARGEQRQAADCYRKVIEFLQQNPDYAEAGYKDMFAERIAELDPQADS